MAFENVASTSTASMESYRDTESERIEMNATQYPNYQSNGNGMANDPNPYGVVDADDDFNETIEEKCEDNVGYRKFIYNNSEQLKSICGGWFSSFSHEICITLIKQQEEIFFSIDTDIYCRFVAADG